MTTLYHLWLTPACRAVRIALAEKCLEFELVLEKTWEQRGEFIALDPAGEVPVLVEADGTVVADSGEICEYLEEVYPETPLNAASAERRAEVRRLVAWFDLKFAREVTNNLIFEKLMKRFMRLGEPDSEKIRAGKDNIHYHLDYIGYLTERRRWLAGEELSYADLAAAAHLSVLDYIGDVPWRDHGDARDWYARLKSRPSFRPLLDDHVAGVPPPKHYAEIDF